MDQEYEVAGGWCQFTYLGAKLYCIGAQKVGNCLWIRLKDKNPDQNGIESTGEAILCREILKEIERRNQEGYLPPPPRF